MLQLCSLLRRFFITVSFIGGSTWTNVHSAVTYSILTLLTLHPASCNEQYIYVRNCFVLSITETALCMFVCVRDHVTGTSGHGTSCECEGLQRAWGRPTSPQQSKESNGFAALGLQSKTGWNDPVINDCTVNP